MYRVLYFLVGVALISVPPVRAETKPISVLTLGNSFAENALEYLPELAGSAGLPLIIGRANLGGCSLERHWNHVVAFEKDPGSKDGSPYGKGTRSLDAMLKSRDWDFITIQQVSIKSHDLTTYSPYAEKLYQYIRDRAPKSKILVHQIWAYRVDDRRFIPQNEGKEPHTHREMYHQVRAAYHKVAADLDLGILPSGDAMFLADTDPEWGYRPDPEFDFENALYPALPDQSHSLHVGWSWRKLKDSENRVLKMDGHHASRAGEYLLGCAWFEKLLGESVIENSFVPKGMDSAYAKFLRQTAHTAVASLETSDAD